MNSEIYDLIIIGGGPAGSAAAVYASRKRLKTLLIVKEWGGQSTVSEDIQNWIGIPHISGTDLAISLQKHVEEYQGDVLSIQTGAYVTLVEKSNTLVTVTTDTSLSFTARALLIATGSERRKLTIPGANEFEHKGITYCASCDGPVFADLDVAVIGGGNAGFESAAQLLAYCKSVTLLNRSSSFKADEITVAKLRSHPNMTILTEVAPIEITGSGFADTLKYKDLKTEEIKELKVSGIFVEIGQLPATGFAKGLISTTPAGQIMINPRTQETDIPGIWAAGDCTDVLYHQNNIAAGDAVRALEDIYLRLHAN